MEYADGGTLEAAIAKCVTESTPFATCRVVAWASQLCAALQHVHAASVLHRDLKTANVFLTQKGDVKLGDFGVARQVQEPMRRSPQVKPTAHASQRRLNGSVCRMRQLSTQTNFAASVVGTPYYMAPETLNEAPYAQAADVWSLGVVIFELLTLCRPFTADSMGALVLKISTGAYNRDALAASPHPTQLTQLASRGSLQGQHAIRIAVTVDGKGRWSRGEAARRTTGELQRTRCRSSGS